MIDGLNVVVCGASEAARVAAGILAHQGHHVWVLSYSSAAQHHCDAASEVALNGGVTISRCQRSINATTGVTVHHELRQRGEVVCVTSRAADVVPSADLVIITSSDEDNLRTLAQELAPFLHRRQLLLVLEGPIARVHRSVHAAINTAAACGARPQGSGTAPPAIVATDSLPWSFTMLDATTVRITAARPLVSFTPTIEASAQQAAQLRRLLEQLFPGTDFRLKTSSAAATTEIDCSSQQPLGRSLLVSSNLVSDSSPDPVSPFLACQQQQQITAAAAKSAIIKGPVGHLVERLSAGRGSSDVAQAAASSSTVTKHVQFAITAW